MEPKIVVHGLADLQRAFQFAEKDAKKEVRTALREVAGPIQRDAESNASRFQNIGPRWGKFRIGVTRSLIYVAPKQRGRQTQKNRAYGRPLFGTKLMDEAMDPALQKNIHNIEHQMEQALDRLATGFYRV